MLELKWINVSKRGPSGDTRLSLWKISEILNKMQQYFFPKKKAFKKCLWNARHLFRPQSINLWCGDVFVTPNMQSSWGVMIKCDMTRFSYVKFSCAHEINEFPCTQFLNLNSVTGSDHHTMTAHATLGHHWSATKVMFPCTHHSRVSQKA